MKGFSGFANSCFREFRAQSKISSGQIRFGFSSFTKKLNQSLYD